MLIKMLTQQVVCGGMAVTWDILLGIHLTENVEGRKRTFIPFVPQRHMKV